LLCVCEVDPLPDCEFWFCEPDCWLFCDWFDELPPAADEPAF